MIYFLGAIAVVYLCIISPPFRLATAIVIAAVAAFATFVLITSGHH